MKTWPLKVAPLPIDGTTRVAQADPNPWYSLRRVRNMDQHDVWLVAKTVALATLDLKLRRR